MQNFIQIWQNMFQRIKLLSFGQTGSNSRPPASQREQLNKI